MIPQSDLDRIREAFPEILQHYGIDPRRNFSIRQDDKDPSCSYSSEYGIVKDFGGENYNVFQFVGAMEGLTDFKEQAARAAEIIGLQIESGAAPAQASYRPKAKRPRFEPPASAGFEPWPIEELEPARAALFKNEAAYTYLLSRGFDRRKILANRFGWVPNRKVIKNDDGSQMFTMYEPNAERGFIVIPFMNREATTANYMMLRTVPGRKPPENKELRPTGCKSPLYREWLLSVGYKVLYIAEGLLDTLALEMLIGRPCLGLGGTALWRRVGQVLNATPEKLRPRRIVLALDSDAPGREASAKIAADLDYLGIPHANFDMPEGCKDPCDALKLVGVANGS